MEDVQVQNSRKVRSNPLFKNTLVKQVVNHMVNGEKYNAKLTAKDEITKIFNNSNEGAPLLNAYEAIKYDTKQSRELRLRLKHYEEDLATLNNGVVEEKRISDLYKYLGQTEPENLNISQKVLQLKNILQQKSNSNNVDLSRISDVKKQKDASFTAYNKERSRVSKLWNQSYNNRKAQLQAEADAVLKPYRLAVTNAATKEAKDAATAELKAKTVEQQQLLHTKLTDASDPLFNVYSLRLQVEQINSDSYRISKTGEVLSYLMEEILYEIVRVIRLSALDRNREAVDKANGKQQVKTQQSILPEDFTSTDFSQCKYAVLFANLLVLKDLKENKLSALDKDAEPITKSVKKYMKTIGKFHPAVATSIAALLFEFLTVFSRLIPQQLQVAKINTVKAEVVHAILQPVFEFGNVNYSEVREQIETIWKK